MIKITPYLSIDEREIQIEFVRSSGPGGQNVNKVATAAQLRFDVGNCVTIPNSVRERLAQLAGRRITGNQTLIINARRFRSQDKNRQDAIDRLVKLIRKAAEKPKIRRKTKPTLMSKKRRLEIKLQRGKTKLTRKIVKNLED